MSALPALKPILEIGASARAVNATARRRGAIEKAAVGTRAGDGDANGAVGVGGFAEGEAVVVARARARRGD